MNKIHILVEGQTEETFVRDVLNSDFNRLGLFLNPILTTTKIVKSGPNFRGGIIKYQKIRKDIKRLLNDSSALAVTTMLDFYGLPDDFPGLNGLNNENLHEKANIIIDNFGIDIGSRKFIPNIVFHEFEGLLFSSPHEFDDIFENKTISSDISRIKGNFQSPESINNGKDTHPSARLRNLIPDYRKVLHGSIIAKRIGLSQIRSECQLFNNWLCKIESCPQH